MCCGQWEPVSGVMQSDGWLLSVVSTSALGRGVCCCCSNATRHTFSHLVLGNLSSIGNSVIYVKSVTVELW